MSDSIFQRLSAMKRDIEATVPQHGGILRCETCLRIQDPRGEYMSVGWPKCHGQTMRWWTQRQIDAGEMPAPAREQEK